MRIGDRFELRDFFDALSVHFFNAWMGDYDPEEVGRYLVENGYKTSQTGKYDLREEKDFWWKSSRGEFLKWRYRQQTTPTKVKEEEQ